MKHTKCLIIGSGPAGYTSAIYASRANMKPLLYTGDTPGGQLTTTNDVENFPGYPNGITGPELMQDLEKQALRFGTEIVYEKIVSVDLINKTAKSESGVDISADTIIISTGAKAKYLGLANEERLNGSGVSACAVCDGFFYKDKIVGIVGGGDTACEEAIYLSHLTEKVHMFIRSDFRASKIMVDRVLKNEKIVVHRNTSISDILGDTEVTGVQTNNGDDIQLNGLFIAIGHTPCSDLFPELEKDNHGYIITNNTKTNIEGVFACGDVQDSTYRQAITAAGSGCMAALEAEKYLNNI